MRGYKFYLNTSIGTSLRTITYTDKYIFEWNGGWAFLNQLKQNPNKQSKVLFILNYDLLCNTEECKHSIARWIRDNKGLTMEQAYGIIDYEQELPVMIEEDINKGRKFNIESMAQHLLKNDEGQYQLELITQKIN